MTEAEKTELKRRIEVMQAFLDGKKIQCYNPKNPDPGWYCVSTPVWDWHFFDYRVAPEKLTVYVYRFGDKFAASCRPIDDNTPVKTIEVEV